ncbi:hypothetical protein [Pseudomonas fluorescens]|uniref:Uncharacterized protein n=1 Tax=Pseudomonas fluorescens TaxID=294 RepID=A0A5E7MRE6_PSEFL|nr:hypothetical protein [Pseudomonas fluorescens]VVP27211.1 hypothetical protein PS854_04112 [Pseudomonas fluorescens]
MSTLCLDAIHRCQIRFTGAQLYEQTGARSRSEFARHCDQLDYPHLYAAPSVAGEQVPRPPNRKWLKMLDEGTATHSGSLNRLAAVYPEIYGVRDHLLWEVPSWDSDDDEAPATYLKHLKPQCRALERSSYRCRTNARMKWTLGVPDWTNLAMPLALLSSSTPGYHPQQRWLHTYFCHYLTLASLSPTYRYCFPDLWALIDRWLQARGLGADASPLKWPVDAGAFKYQQALHQLARKELMDRGWLPEVVLPTRCALAMLWSLHLGGPQLTQQLERSHSRGGRRCPASLRHLMRDLDPRLNVAV